MEVSLPLGTWDGLRFFIVALPGPSINYFSYFPSLVLELGLSLGCSGSCLLLTLLIAFFKF